MLTIVARYKSLNIVQCSVLNLNYNTLIRRMSSIKESSKINYNSKHLTKGDSLSPWNGKLRLYNMRYCPFAQRSVLALIAKNADFEIVNIDLRNKPEWLTVKSSLGKVPALEVSENNCLIESLVITEYIDESFPRRPLLSKDPFKKASDKIIVEMTGAIPNFFYKKVKGIPITDDVNRGYTSSLTYIENELNKRGTSFLHGSEPGFADYMIWPWFERIPLLVDFDPTASIDERKFPNLIQYIKNMEKDPVVREYIIPLDIHKQYLENYAKGIVDYELLNK